MLRLSGAAVAVAAVAAGWQLFTEPSFPQTDLSAFSTAPLERLVGFEKSRGETVLAKSLWKDEGAIVIMEASRVAQFKRENPGLPPLFAIVKEDEYVFGKRGFVAKSKFDGPIYLDVRQASFKAFGHEQGALGGFTKYRMWQNYRRAVNDGFFPKDHTLKGDSLLTGGVICVGPGETGLLYEHKELVWGDRIDLNEMKRRCGRPGPKL